MNADANGLAPPLSSYLESYLDFLRLAGNHVFFDLPDFGAMAKTDYTDYALVREHVGPDEYCKDVTLFGIATETINNFLRNQWAGAKVSAFESHDYLAASLVEISTNWLTSMSMGGHFFIHFGVPYIKPLCPHEVILFFDVKDVAFFDDANFKE